METENIEEKLKIVLEHYNAKIIDDWSKKADVYFTSELTADGYEVYIATENMKSPSFKQDVYYYEADWFDKLYHCIIDGMTIHVDEYNQKHYGFEKVITEVYEDYLDESED